MESEAAYITWGAIIGAAAGLLLGFAAGILYLLTRSHAELQFMYGAVFVPFITAAWGGLLGLGIGMIAGVFAHDKGWFHRKPRDTTEPEL